jgi:hypothetical protein
MALRTGAYNVPNKVQHPITNDEANFLELVVLLFQLSLLTELVRNKSCACASTVELD